MIRMSQVVPIPAPVIVETIPGTTSTVISSHSVLVTIPGYGQWGVQSGPIWSNLVQSGCFRHVALSRGHQVDWFGLGIFLYFYPGGVKSYPSHPQVISYDVNDGILKSMLLTVVVSSWCSTEDTSRKTTRIISGYQRR